MKYPVFFLFCLVSAKAFASLDCLNIPPTFAVEIVREEANGTQVIQKLFAQGDKLRSEITMDGKTAITILDSKLGKVIGILDESKEYVVFPFVGFPRNPNHVNIEAVFDKEASCEKIGEEVINGIEADKVKITSKSRGNVICWVDRKLKMPLKFSNELETRHATWRNFDGTAVLSKLFDLPVGYSEKVMPNAR